ncbi:hypothetical protein MTP04_02920 [Lysinibacillus sp. PLM2]|nr:hypothetical protein MTP04_02920 [Lysinibacillus sp. PLM2]
MKINWKVRFSKENLTFWLRFLGALLIPILAYFGWNFEDLNNWEMVGKLLVNFVSNPFLIGLTIINAINLIPDPTTKGLSDSEQALTYQKPKGDK